MTGTEAILTCGTQVVPVTELNIWTERTVDSDVRILITVNKLQVQLVCIERRRGRMTVSEHFYELRLHVIPDISFLQTFGCNQRVVVFVSNFNEAWIKLVIRNSVLLSQAASVA